MKSFVEEGCPPGHVNWIRALLDSVDAGNDDIQLLTYDAFRERIGDVPAVHVSLGAAPQTGRSRVLRRLRSLSVLRRAWKHIPGGDVCFLSYDPFVMIWPGMRRRGIQVFEHNNVDRAEASLLYRAAYRMLPRHLRHICHEPYIAEHIASRYGKRTRVIPHPVRQVSASAESVDRMLETFGDYYFAPTPCPEITVVRRAGVELARRGMGLVTRAPAGREAAYRDLPDNVEILEGSLDYDAAILAAQGVGILNRYQYRVSAVFFEALSAGKRCLMRDCLFARQAGETYQDAEIDLLPP